MKNLSIAPILLMQRIATPLIINQVPSRDHYDGRRAGLEMLILNG